MFVLPVFAILLLLLLVFLLLLRLDAVALLELAEAEGVGHESLVGCLFLLLDGEKGILADLGSSVAQGIRVLRRNEVLVGSTNLSYLSETQNPSLITNRTHLLILFRRQYLVDPLLAQ